MKTAISPRLKRYCSNLVEVSNYLNDWFCLDGLTELVEIPDEAEVFWVEASDRQWPNRSGIAVEVNGGCDGYRIGDSGGPLCELPCEKLIKGGLITDENEWKKIYFRVLYEE